jgi:resuscitation-promoting factor RpfB
MGSPVSTARSKLLRTAVQVTALAALVGGTVGVGTLHKDVTVDLNGQAVEMVTYRQTVGDVLATNDVALSATDEVFPALDAKVADGETITVRHARPLAVSVDGATSTVWTTSLTVGEALAGAGIETAGARVSPAPGTEIPLAGLTLTVSTPKTVSFTADGETTEITTTGVHVADLLAELEVRLGEADRLSVPATAELTDGLAVELVRVGTAAETVTEEIPFETVEKKSDELFEGEKKVETEGVVGSRDTTYEVVTENGVEISRTVTSEAVTAEPVQEVVLVGTQAKPAPAPAPAPAAAAGSASASGSSDAEEAESSDEEAPAAPSGSPKDIARSMVGSDSEFRCLEKLWEKESNWNHRAENSSSGAYGIPQALPGSKMASHGSDWRTNPATQIAWGLDYIEGRYGDACGAWGHSQSNGWY